VPPLECLAPAKAEHFAARKDQRLHKAAARKRKDVSCQSPRRSNGMLEMQIARAGRRASLPVLDNGHPCLFDDQLAISWNLVGRVKLEA
jgi:hypothetical protein